MKRKSIHSPEHRELVTLLHDLRLQADLSQTEVAEALGRPQTYVSAVEVGRRGVDLLQVREFCEVYEISFPKFVERYERRLKAATSESRPPRLSPRTRSSGAKAASKGKGRAVKDKPGK